jgi:hypothetical protein
MGRSKNQSRFPSFEVISGTLSTGCSCKLQIPRDSWALIEVTVTQTLPEDPRIGTMFKLNIVDVIKGNSTFSGMRLVALCSASVNMINLDLPGFEKDLRKEMTRILGA